MSNSQHDFGALLRRYRTDLRMTQEELAAHADLSSRTIRDVERGAVRAPRRSSAEALATALKLSGTARADFLDSARAARWLQPGQPTDERNPIPTPRQLPADPSFFTGRLRELEALDARRSVDTQAHRSSSIIAIVGTAGVGKTALAVHWARRLVDQFPDGHLFVNLHGYDLGRPTRPVDALAGVLRSQGIANEDIPVDEEDVARLYRSLMADKRMLVVLDNARSPEQVRPLLPGSEGCLVVVTSRHTLSGLMARDGARRIVLSMLPANDAITLLTQMVGGPRVVAEPDALSELATLCSFMPLSLRIAAASLASREHQPISDYVAMLNGGNSLAAFALDGDERSTVRTVFDQSYGAMSPAEQAVFRLASAVPGPTVTVTAIAALSGMPVAEADRLLRGLATVHMINEESFGRYSFHDLLRIYANERAREADDDTETALRRLFSWYLSTTSRAAEMLYPERIRLPLRSLGEAPTEPGLVDRDSAISWLEAERPNLVAAIYHAAEHGPAAISWQLVDALRGYFWLHSPSVEWLNCANAALGAAHAAGADDGEAAARLGIAQLFMHQGRHRESLEAYQDSLDAMRRAGWHSGEAATLSHLGNVHMHAGMLTEARDLQSQALTLARGFGLRDSEAHALHGLGRVATLTGELDRARDLVEQANVLFVQIGHRHGAAHSSIDLAIIHRDEGRYEDAIDMMVTATEMAADLAQPVLDARCHNTFGGIYQTAGNHDRSHQHYDRALRLATGIGSTVHEAEALIGLARAASGLGRLEDARRHGEAAISLCRQANYRVLEGDAHVTLAEIHLQRGNTAQVERHARRALHLYHQSGHRTGTARASALVQQE